MSSSKETFTCVVMYCVKYCEKMADLSWLGYKFQYYFHFIKELFYKLCVMCHNSKGKRKHIFSAFHNYTS